MTICALPSCQKEFPEKPGKRFCHPNHKRKMEKALRFFALEEVRTGRTTERYIEELYDRHHGETG